MAKFTKTTQVNASVGRAWEIIGDLTFMDRMGGAMEVRVEGMQRVCTFANGVVQHEEITNYSPGKHSYNYRIEGSPLPVRNNRGKFAIEPAGTHCMIVWDAEFEPLDPSQGAEISQMWDGAMKQVLESLKQHIEDRK